LHVSARCAEVGLPRLLVDAGLSCLALRTQLRRRRRHGARAKVSSASVKSPTS
jgi:hypothetical protein